MSMTRIAVYGTLRRGQGNHPLLAYPQLAIHVGDGVTVQGGVMYTAGGFPILDLNPVEEASKYNTSIRVEVYDVPKSVLSGVDRLEGYPGWYNRSHVDIILDGGEKVKAYIYHQDALDPLRYHPIPSGDWVDR